MKKKHLKSHLQDSNSIKYPYYRVYDESGEQYCDCSHEEYAIKTLWLHRENQNEIFTYHKINAPILDQTVDVTATRERELPGQQGLPKAKERLPFEPEEYDFYLPENGLQQF